MSMVLGIDPGLAHCGFAIVRLLPDGEELVGLTVVRTEKSGKKRGVRASDDSVRRAAELAVEIERMTLGHGVDVFACEAMSFPRNSPTAQKMGMAWGVITAIATSHAIPIVQASPQDIKKKLCGAKNATKDDIIQAIERRFPDAEWPTKKTVWEHCADAAGAVLACLDSQAIQMARRFAAEPRSAAHGAYEEES